LGNKRIVAWAFNALTEFYRRRAEITEARNLGEIALSIAGEVGDKQLRGSILLELAIVFAESNNLDASLAYATQAMSLFDETSDSFGKFRALARCVMVYRYKHQREKSWQIAHSAIEALLMVGTDITTLLDTRISAERQVVYEALIQEAQHQASTSHVFELIEQLKGRTFVDLLGSGLRIPQGLPQELINRERQLLASFKTEQLHVLNEPQSTSHIELLLQHQKQLEEIWQSISTFSPEYVTLRSSRSLTFNQTRAATSDALLIEYYCADDGILLIGVRAEWNEPKVVEIRMPLADIRRETVRYFGEEL
jgi:hypothetical protein